LEILHRTAPCRNVLVTFTLELMIESGRMSSAEFWKRFPASVCVMFAMSMLYLEYLWYQDLVTARHAAAWSNIRGLVVRSATERAACKNQFEPDMRYTYAVRGRSYKGWRIALGVGECTTDAQARTIAAQLPLGGVDVYVDPHRPQNSALVVGTVSSRTFSSMEDCGVLGGASAAIAALLLWSCRRSGSAASRASREL
jgi:hypothetical protein